MTPPRAGPGAAGASRPPAYLVKGDDPALVGEALRRLVRDLAGDDAALVVEDYSAADEGGAARAADAARTPPFLSDRRVVVLRDSGELTADAEAPLVECLEDPLPTTTLVLAGRGVPRKLAAAVRKVGTVVAAAPEGKERRGWVAQRLKEAPVRLDQAAANLVASHLGEDLARLGALLDLLAAAYGAGARLGPDDVTPYLGEGGGVAPWDLTDAIDRGDVPGALALLHRQLEGGGRHPLQVLAALHSHYAHLLRLDGAGIAGGDEAAAVLRVHPFRAGKLLEQARRLGHGGVVRAIVLLAQADLDLKGARDLPGALVLEVLVARLCRLRPAAPTGSTRSKGASRARSDPSER